MSEITKEDFNRFEERLSEWQDGIRKDIKDFGDKLSGHMIEDEKEKTRSTNELTAMRTKLDSLTEMTSDRNKFVRGWVAGLLAVAVAAAVGFMFKAAITVEAKAPASSTSPTK